MKIVHICLNAYTDGWGYQENLLTQYQKNEGHEVTIISSINHLAPYLKEKEIKEIKSRGCEYVFNGIKTYRLKTRIHTTNLSVLNPGLFRTLNKIQPDIIFHHDCCVPSLLKAIFYKIFHPKVKIVVDNHADIINQSPNKVWNFVYNRICVQFGLKLITPFVTKYYGVTPARCSFLKSPFGVPENKISLLPIGGDTDLVDSIKESNVELRRKYKLPANEMIIISGGKMGIDKGTISLIKAFKRLREAGCDLYLVLFGMFSDTETEILAKESEGVFIYGWCDRQKTIELLKLSDIACWPIHHTTLIEDAVACATPVVLRNTGNTVHSVEGNGILIDKGTEDELVQAFTAILYSGHYNNYKISADKMKEKFGYHNISKQIIDDCITYDLCVVQKDERSQ